MVLSIGFIYKHYTPLGVVKLTRIRSVGLEMTQKLNFAEAYTIHSEESLIPLDIFVCEIF